MENPISKFFPFEERQDGVYICVSSENAKKVNLNEIINELQTAKVINYDFARIKEVIEKASGKYEKIGPLFEYYNGEIANYIDINISPMKASIIVSSVAIANSIKITEQAILYFLQTKGVIHGIKSEAIHNIVANTIFDKEVVVAEGTEPIPGEDAKIVYEVDIDLKNKPQEEKDGKVDYRNIHSVITVEKGKVVARKIPPTPGTHGTDIMGNPIEATPGKDLVLKGGKNTMVSQDGMYLIATKSGNVYKQGDLLCVDEVLCIKRDVDFSVGNIKYCGDIEIFGNVLPGFTVETEGNINIKGEVESAKIISRNGSIKLEKGILGKQDMILYAKQDIYLVFAQSAIITAENTLNVNKYCLHCDITCGSLIGADSKASIIGGKIIAFSKIEIGNTGNETGVETKIFVVDKEEHAINDKINQLMLLKEKLEKEIEPIKKQLKTKAAIIKQMGSHASTKIAEEVKHWIDAYNKLAVKLKYVDEKINFFQNELKKPRQYNGYIKILGDIFPGTEINLYGMTKIIKNHMINKMFHIKDGQIQAEG